MGRRSARGIGLGGTCAVALLLIGAASPQPAVPERRPPLRSDAQHLVLPPVERDDLLSPTVAPPHVRQRTSISLQVAPPRDDRGWVLTMRRSPMPSRGPATQSPRVYWKLVSESPSDFRPLGTQAQLVKRSPHPTREQITIDVGFGVDWAVAPGRYDVDFLFELDPL